MIIDIYNTDKKYQLIVADPPWRQFKTIRKCRPNQKKELDYPVCSLEEIKEHLRAANSLTAENSVLFLWTIDKYLIEAEKIATEKATKHSKKPEIAFDIVNCLYPTLTKLELYARETREGYDCWGNEVTK